jgi:hypothetical protein
MAPRFLLLLIICAACARTPQARVVTTPPVVERADSHISTRPLPLPIVYPSAFQRAIDKGTRTTTGSPGPRYWTQFANYRLNARLLPENKRLEGSAVITYRNNSPDTLRNLHIDLTQNYHKGDAVRSEPAEVTNGVELKRVSVDRRELRTGGTKRARATKSTARA